MDQAVRQGTSLGRHFCWMMLVMTGLSSPLMNSRSLQCCPATSRATISLEVPICTCSSLIPALKASASSCPCGTMNTAQLFFFRTAGSAWSNISITYRWAWLCCANTLKVECWLARSSRTCPVQLLSFCSRRTSSMAEGMSLGTMTVLLSSNSSTLISFQEGRGECLISMRKGCTSESGIHLSWILMAKCLSWAKLRRTVSRMKDCSMVMMMQEECLSVLSIFFMFAKQTASISPMFCSLPSGRMASRVPLSTTTSYRPTNSAGTGFSMSHT